MRVLGIETSCDETGIAIYDSEEGLLAHTVYSQTAIHNPYGGVVPELASRDHIQKTLPLIENLLATAQMNLTDLHGIAYTAGPGLIGSLLVGACLAKSLAYGLGLPALGVHHMEGHLLAPMLEKEPPSFPFVALLVSGGHTQLFEVNGLGNYRLLGESLDDAAGEAFDKTAKLLGLSYPGGPLLAKLAEQGVPHRFHFPRPMTDRPGLDFSFSGLKTFALNTLHSHDNTEQTKADIAYAFQEAVVETLLIKCKRALLQTKHTRLVLAGGVSANQRLRQSMNKMALGLGCKVYYPRIEFCTDNGAMIAYVGCLRLMQDACEDLTIQAYARGAMPDDTLIKS